MVTYVKSHKIVSLLTAVLLIAVGCMAGMVIHDARSEPVQWIVFGGNTDPGDGQGGGQAKDQLVATGWVAPENVFQVQWRADIGSGTTQATADAMPAGHDAYNRLCQNGCIIAGFSLGTMPAIQLRAETGHPPDNLYIFGGPEQSTGLWHQQYQDNPFVQPWVQHVGKLDPNQLPPAGTHAWYHLRDPYANAAPQCSGPGLYALTLAEHRIVSRDEANHVWTGPDGVVNHEAGYTGPIGLPASGSDPSQPWAGCLFNDWKSTPNSPGDETTEGELPLGGNGGPLPVPPGGLPEPAIPGAGG
ncbi:hypothetical protein HWB99_gp047 [Mycobacterium phage DrLupo]|uniref:PE-PPE domain-containing protein n=1 Tax=Mycobacterium phage DrLupo TaxID=2499037 RepID=A0A3S9UQM4_9CAUD|nr:hypothetical protein HWB99_gp047 [Mycobacterium phage DrLupo]AZS12583.1 hypothetical protein SEA_DRLUPO_47 [Mycobacterium phage DrLupo]